MSPLVRGYRTAHSWYEQYGRERKQELAKRNFEFAAMDVLEGEAAFPQFTPKGMEEAQAFRNEQIWRLGLPKNYPAFVLRIPTPRDHKIYLTSCIPLTLDQAKALTQVKAFDTDPQKQLENQKKVFEVLTDIGHSIESGKFTTTPPELPAEYLYDCLLKDDDKNRIAQIFCKMPQEILRFKMLPLKHVKAEAQRELDELNSSMKNASSLEDVCHALGHHIPRLIQIHPFAHGNRYLFAQLAREILLNYGFPCTPCPNFKLFGMAGARELTDLLLQNVTDYQMLEDLYQTHPSRFGIAEEKTFKSSAGEDIKQVAHNLASNSAYMPSEELTPPQSEPTTLKAETDSEVVLSSQAFKGLWSRSSYGSSQLPSHPTQDMSGASGTSQEYESGNSFEDVD